MRTTTERGLKLVLGAGLRPLTRALIEQLRARQDPYERPYLCVPNREVQSWLKNEIAGALGVCMNYELTSLERALGDIARRHGVDDDVWTSLTLSRALLEALAEVEREGGASWQALRSLLEPVAPTSDGLGHEALPERSPASRARRAYRFASHLARLLLGYAWTHPRMLEEWARGEVSSSSPASWQADLWRRALRLSSENGSALAAPGTLVDGLPPALTTPPIIVFGFAYLSPLERHVVEGLAARVSVTCYLDTVLRDDEHEAVSSSPIKRWSAPASVTTAALKATAAEVTHLAGDARRPLSPLDRLRVCLAAPGADPGSSGIDDEILVLGAPGPRREAEAITDCIWQRLATTPHQKLSDVAVYSAQYEAQISWLEDRFAAQHRLLHSAPHGGRSSRLLDVAVELLELPERGARRDAVLAVLTHACFRGHSGSRLSGLGGYSTLAAAAGIYLGLDGDDPELRYLDGEPRFHWLQGLSRLQLGAMMDGQAALALGDEELLSTELPWARDDVQQLHAWASSLLSDLHTLSTWELSGSAWARVLEDLVRTYLAPRNDADGTHWAALLAALRALDDADRAAPRAKPSSGAISLSSNDAAPFGYAIAVEMVRDQLGTLGGARGQFLTNGVSVTRLVKNRAVPFRSVLISGLGEGIYPSREIKDPLDARSDEVEVTNRQLKELAFLQAVLSAEEQLILSWTSEDTAKDAPLAPSALIEELCDAMPALRVQRQPLTAHEGGADDVDRPSLRHDADAARRADALALRLEVDRAVESKTGTPPSFLPSLVTWQETLSDENDVHRRTGIAPPPDTFGVERESRTQQRLTIWDFTNFLSDPVEASAGRLGLTGWNLQHDEEALVETEPFAVTTREMWLCAREVLGKSFSTSKSAAPDDQLIRDAVRAEMDALQSVGALPHGALVAPDVRQTVEARVGKVVRALEDAGAYARGYDGVVALGPGRTPWPGRRSKRALLLDVDGRPVEISGESGCLFGPPKDRIIVELTKSTQEVSEASHDMNFRQRMQLLLLLLADEVEEESVARGVWVTGRGAVRVADYRMPTRDDARAFLATLVRAMSSATPARVLPLAALGDLPTLVELARAPERKEERAQAYRQVWQTIAREWRHREQEPEAYRGALRSRSGLLPPSCDELFASVDARFGPLVDMRSAS